VGGLHKGYKYIKRPTCAQPQANNTGKTRNITIKDEEQKLQRHIAMLLGGRRIGVG
jgi:hypothetical protein